jgi:hypothetical protein
MASEGDVTSLLDHAMEREIFVTALNTTNTLAEALRVENGRLRAVIYAANLENKRLSEQLDRANAEIAALRGKYE